MTPNEIRKRILEVVGTNGGHLASSLGAVEIACALNAVFDASTDRIVWDVGHQAYAWKILTGRNDAFGTLRKLNGIAPFPNPAESRADAAIAGHAGSALSVAVGMACARDRKRSGEHVVAVVGDASMANGHSFEALNACAAATEKLIVVLNDNEMSISKPCGSLPRILGRLIADLRYNRVKAAAEATGHRLKLTFLRDIYHKVESRVKGLFLANRYFEQFGLRYIGPVDGHDLKALTAAFTVAKEDKRSVLVHVVTQKGHGYPPAEKNPTLYHGIAAGALAKGDDAVSSAAAAHDWSAALGAALVDLARTDERIFALTAGMKTGTGLAEFARTFPNRFLDVGIAEGHMVSCAAGMAASGMRPVVCVYSTFLQRAIDQVIHDVAISSLPVVLCIDRAGAVGADGATHQGLYDFALLKAIPNLTIVQPCDAAELSNMLVEALSRPGPTAIRYPRGFAPSLLKIAHNASPQTLAVQVARPDASMQIWATGDELEKACAVADAVGAGVVYSRSLKPFDVELLNAQRASGKKIVSLENGTVCGGFGESIGADLRLGWPDEFIPHGSVAELERRYGLDVASLVKALSSIEVGYGTETAAMLWTRSETL